MEIKDRITLKATIDTTEIDTITEKAERFCKLMNEAMELANSIAEMKLNIPISTVVNDNSAELASITTE